MRESRHPVVMAGLLGSATVALGIPGTARALPLTQMIDEALISPTVGLVVGAAGGALLTGATVAAVSRVRARRAQELEPLKPAPRHMRGFAPAGGGDAAFDLDAELDLGQEPESAPERELGDAPARATEPAPEAEPGSAAPSHAATNYEQIAENYIKRASFKARMARRAEGVAATLRDRMDATKMDGVPVIERADGTVGDVGTSWWNDAVGESAHAPSIAEAPSFEAVPSDFSLSDRDRLIASGRKDRSSISERVAFVDEGAYPEHRTFEDIERPDDWESALRSLDEKIASVAPPQDPIGFIDSVGGPDSLDEPDNIEPQTAFIPFKTPGGHPEVVDTDSYVDYLIQDEFSKNSSTAARRSSRRFLRLLEGGTQPPASRHLADSSSSSMVRVGRHFAAPQAAAEA